MVATTDQKIPPIHHLTRDEAREIFDRQAHRELDMSGEEFVRAWDAGEFDDVIDGPNHLQIMNVAMLLPLVR